MVSIRGSSKCGTTSPVWKAVQRALRYSQSQGVLHVASAGNSNYDLAHKITDTGSPKHRVVVAHLAGVVARRRQGRVAEVVVPTTVRVEAAWDRTAPSAAAINRFPVRDHVLDPGSADVAARIQLETSTGVADAHIGAAVRSLSSSEVVVLTSAPDDIASACSPARVTIVKI